MTLKSDFPILAFELSQRGMVLTFLNGGIRRWCLQRTRDRATLRIFPDRGTALHELREMIVNGSLEKFDAKKAESGQSEGGVAAVGHAAADYKANRRRS